MLSERVLTYYKNCNCIFFVILEYCSLSLVSLPMGNRHRRIRSWERDFAFLLSTSHAKWKMLSYCCAVVIMWKKTLNVNLYYNYYYSVLGLYTLCYIVVSYLEASALLASLPLRKKALENGLLSNQGRGPTLSSFYVVNKNIHYAFTYTYRFFWKYITRALLASFRILRLTYLFF